MCPKVGVDADDNFDIGRTFSNFRNGPLEHSIMEKSRRLFTSSLTSIEETVMERDVIAVDEDENVWVTISSEP